MIIKLYTADAKIVILEDVSNITVYRESLKARENEWLYFDYRDQIDTDEFIQPDVYEKNPEEINMGEYFSWKFIDYRNKAGDKKRIPVLKRAYICNDEGKTIETVTC
jgi:hypothetical protein